MSSYKHAHQIVGDLICNLHDQLELSDVDIDSTLGALDGLSRDVTGGMRPGLAKGIAEAFAAVSDLPERYWPRSWRSRQADMSKARLAAYHILNVAHRSENPMGTGALVYAQLGSQLAYHRGWTEAQREFEMMELMTAASARVPQLLQHLMRRYRGFADMEAQHPLKLEYIARQMDLLQMFGRWTEASDLIERLVLPFSTRTETAAFQAARILQIARGRVRGDADDRLVEYLLECGEAKLIEHSQLVGAHHEFFEYFQTCVRIEFFARQGAIDVAESLARYANSRRITGGLPVHFLRDAKQYTRVQSRLT